MEMDKEMQEKAMQKIDKESGEADSVTGEIGLFLSSWVGFDARAAALVLNEKKSIKEAYEKMEAQACKKKKSNQYTMTPIEAGDIILTYFGCPNSQEILEGGLMYAMLMARAERLKPYGVDVTHETPAVNPQTPAKIIEATAGGISTSLADFL